MSNSAMLKAYDNWSGEYDWYSASGCSQNEVAEDAFAAGWQAAQQTAAASAEDVKMVQKQLWEAANGNGYVLYGLAEEALFARLRATKPMPERREVEIESLQRENRHLKANILALEKELERLRSAS